MKHKSSLIGIDGQSAAGKDTAARMLVYYLNLIEENSWRIIDSSGFYRTIALFLEDYHPRLNIPPLTQLSDNNAHLLEEIISGMQIEVVFDNFGEISVGDMVHCYEYGERGLHCPRADIAAAKLGALNSLRSSIYDHIFENISQGSALMTGRDTFWQLANQFGETHHIIGVYIYAPRTQRAKQRSNQREMDYEQVMADIRKRDLIDANRTNAPKVPVNMKDASERGYQVCIHNNGTLHELGSLLALRVGNQLGWRIHFNEIQDIIWEYLKS